MSSSFPPTYARMLARELQLDAEGIRHLLDGTSLREKDLLTLDSQISPADQYRIIQNGLVLSGNPALGLQIGMHMPLSAHGALGVAFATAPTTLEAFRLLARFGILRVPTPAIRVETYTDGPYFRLALHSDLPMDVVGGFLVEVMLASITMLTEAAPAHAGCRPVIELAYPAPVHADRYPDYLHHAELHFGQANTTVTFRSADLQTPNPFADHEVHAQAIAMCERLQTRLGSQESWCSKVTSLLQQHPGHIWQIQDIAGALHVSVRSLTRHLRQEESSYQLLLDAELCRQACLHLALPDHTVASVASLLGYRDVSSFRRAFHRWCGTSPQAWREESRADRARMA